MFTVVTVKMVPETEEELSSSFALQVDSCRKHFDSLKDEGVFGPQEQVAIRYLVIGGAPEANITSNIQAAVKQPERPVLD